MTHNKTCRLLLVLGNLVKAREYNLLLELQFHQSKFRLSGCLVGSQLRDCGNLQQAHGNLIKTAAREILFGLSGFALTLSLLKIDWKFSCKD